ncbi:MarR family winged helix-turn-helix transcriptional regulator [Sporolactobacillus inulinus]|uniref:MarR family transcriptional regulator n=1 Tax=Sporolactobacillus inulinus CASD TaxID=1069536 RepID=A0A0U1QPA5_9BACL|nr:MarR family transcriptional regulator [Sporolactobacillus inulinus]KLI02605.1 MarR family transcriptional regulator [Sporolactobacillus inulinus CASD]GEB76720.1 MarR family transcriptional regulator [Sporolactobacillus inulinus]
MKPAFRLEDHLCFSIYSCSRAIQRMYQPALKKLGITYPQYLVLLVLWENRECSVKQIGALLDLDSGTLTPLLKRMEGKALLQRKRSQVDERMVTVRLTEKGAALKEKTVCIPETLIRSSRMTQAEMQNLNRTIKLLTQQVTQGQMK